MRVKHSFYENIVDGKGTKNLTILATFWARVGSFYNLAEGDGGTPTFEMPQILSCTYLMPDCMQYFNQTSFCRKSCNSPQKTSQFPYLVLSLQFLNPIPGNKRKLKQTPLS